jgi:poly(A) polymerase
LLRAAAGEADAELADWWTQYQDGNADAPPPTPAGAGRRRSRRGGRRRRRTSAATEGE